MLYSEDDLFQHGWTITTTIWEEEVREVFEHVFWMVEKILKGFLRRSGFVGRGEDREKAKSLGV